MTRRPAEPLTPWKKILVGLGALTPLAADFLVVNFAALQTTAASAPPALMGYLGCAAVDKPTGQNPSAIARRTPTSSASGRPAASLPWLPRFRWSNRRIGL